MSLKHQIFSIILSVFVVSIASANPAILTANDGIVQPGVPVVPLAPLVQPPTREILPQTNMERLAEVQNNPVPIPVEVLRPCEELHQAQRPMDVRNERQIEAQRSQVSSFINNRNEGSVERTRSTEENVLTPSRQNLDASISASGARTPNEAEPIQTPMIRQAHNEQVNPVELTPVLLPKTSVRQIEKIPHHEQGPLQAAPIQTRELETRPQFSRPEQASPVQASPVQSAPVQVRIQEQETRTELRHQGEERQTPYQQVRDLVNEQRPLQAPISLPQAAPVRLQEQEIRAELRHQPYQQQVRDLVTEQRPLQAPISLPSALDASRRRISKWPRQEVDALRALIGRAGFTYTDEMLRQNAENRRGQGVTQVQQEVRPEMMAERRTYLNLTELQRRQQRIGEMKRGNPDLFQHRPRRSLDNRRIGERFLYTDEFARNKLYPMAAAAYGEEQDINQCLNSTFSEARLVRDIVVQCQDRENQVCSGFTAVSNSERAIIVSFRGTNSFPQLFIESYQTFFEDKIALPNGQGNVSAYFYEIFTQLWVENEMMLDVARLIREYPDFNIWVTGHSLGGALAALAAKHIQMDIIPDQANRIFLLTLGQPRTGDQFWAASVDQGLPNFTYRIVHSHDIVSHVPPSGSLFPEFRHHMTEIWYPTNMLTDTILLQPGAMKVCSGFDEDPQCSNGAGPYTIHDHLFYYGRCVTGFGRTGCRRLTMLGAADALRECLDFPLI